MYTTII